MRAPVLVFVKYLTKHSYAADNEKMFLQLNIEKYINYNQVRLNLFLP